LVIFEVKPSITFTARISRTTGTVVILAELTKVLLSQIRTLCASCTDRGRITCSAVDDLTAGHTSLCIKIVTDYAILADQHLRRKGAGEAVIDPKRAKLAF
jgi:hypothetical protein